MFCLASCSNQAPAEVALHLIGRGHDGAAIAGMRLDDLALPFGIEQIGKTFRRFLRLHQIGVVGDDAEPDAQARKLAVDVLVFGGIELRDVFRHIGRQNAVALPDDEMRGIRRIHHIDRVDVAGIFLADALEHALRACALDAHGDAGIFRLERLRQFLRDRQIGRGVVADLAFLLRGLDQRRRDRFRRRRRGHDAGRERRARKQCACPLEHVAARYPGRFHWLILPACSGQILVHPKLSFIPSAQPSLSSTACSHCR